MVNIINLVDLEYLRYKPQGIWVSKNHEKWRNEWLEIIHFPHCFLVVRWWYLAKSK
jgi:hypothetical protein